MNLELSQLRAELCERGESYDRNGFTLMALYVDRDIGSTAHKLSAPEIVAPMSAAAVKMETIEFYTSEVIEREDGSFYRVDVYTALRQK